MCFLYMFDLLDFDNKGKLKESKKVALPQAQSNFLYLVSKFNQNLLKEKGLPVPEFFKEELGQILAEVEKGWDFDVAKKKVFAACLPQINALVGKPEKEIVSALVEGCSYAEAEFADKIKEAKNHLQLEYIMTITSGKVFNKAESMLAQQMTKENKSKLFKEIIKYNALISATEKVREKATFQPQSVGVAG